MSHLYSFDLLAPNAEEFDVYVWLSRRSPAAQSQHDMRSVVIVERI